MLGAGLEQDQQESAFVEDTGGGGVVGINGQSCSEPLEVISEPSSTSCLETPVLKTLPFLTSQQLPAPKCTSLLLVSPPQARWGCGIHCSEGPGLIGLTCVHSEPLARKGLADVVPSLGSHRSCLRPSLGERGARRNTEGSWLLSAGFLLVLCGKLPPSDWTIIRNIMYCAVANEDGGHF